LASPVPAHLGHVEKSSFLSKKQPFIVHLQDAHANEAAQRNNASLIRHHQQESEIDLVLVEGTVGKLDAQYLQFSKNKQVNDKIVKTLAGRGELTSSDLYLYEHGNDIEFIGIEEPELYKKNIHYLKEVLSQQDVVDQWVRQQRKLLDKEITRHANKDLVKLLRHILHQDKQTPVLENISLIQQLSKKHLKKDLIQSQNAKQFPQLVRLTRLKQEEGKVNIELAKNEWSVIARQATNESWQSQDLIKQIEETLFGSSNDNPRHLLEELYARLQAIGFDFRDYPHLSQLARIRIYQHELKSKELFSEIEMLQNLLLSELSVTQKEESLAHEVKQFLLTSKLLKLELTRKQWDLMGTWIFDTPSGVSKMRVPQPLLSSSLSFYKTAIARETIFQKNMQKILKQKKKSKAILITGGFHTPALHQFYEDSGWSYSIVSPHISDGSKTNYSQVILGTSSAKAVDWATVPVHAKSLGVSLERRTKLVRSLEAVSAESLGIVTEVDVDEDSSSFGIGFTISSEERSLSHEIEVLIQEGNYQRAIELAKEGHGKFPKNSIFKKLKSRVFGLFELSKKAKIAMKRRRYREVLRILEPLLPDYPSDVVIHTQVARALFKLGRTRKAIEAIEKAIAIDPEDARSYMIKAEIMSSNRYYLQSALETVNHALKLDPAAVESKMKKINILKAIGNRKSLEAALVLIEHELKLHPSDVGFRRKKAEIYKELGDATRDLKQREQFYRKALKVLKKIIKMTEGRDWIAYQAKALLLALLGKTKDAFMAIDAAEEIKGSTAEIQRTRRRIETVAAGNNEFSAESLGRGRIKNEMIKDWELFFEITLETATASENFLGVSFSMADRRLELMVLYLVLRGVEGLEPLLKSWKGFPEVYKQDNDYAILLKSTTEVAYADITVLSNAVEGEKTLSTIREDLKSYYYQKYSKSFKNKESFDKWFPGIVVTTFLEGLKLSEYKDIIPLLRELENLRPENINQQPKRNIFYRIFLFFINMGSAFWELLVFFWEMASPPPMDKKIGPASYAVKKTIYEQHRELVLEYFALVRDQVAEAEAKAGREFYKSSLFSITYPEKESSFLDLRTTIPFLRSYFEDNKLMFNIETERLEKVLMARQGNIPVGAQNFSKETYEKQIQILERVIIETRKEYEAIKKDKGAGVSADSLGELVYGQRSYPFTVAIMELASHMAQRDLHRYRGSLLDSTQKEFGAADLLRIFRRGPENMRETEQAALSQSIPQQKFRKILERRFLPQAHHYPAGEEVLIAFLQYPLFTNEELKEGLDVLAPISVAIPTSRTLMEEVLTIRWMIQKLEARIKNGDPEVAKEARLFLNVFETLGGFSKKEIQRQADWVELLESGFALPNFFSVARLLIKQKRSEEARILLMKAQEYYPNSWLLKWSLGLLPAVKWHQALRFILFRFLAIFAASWEEQIKTDIKIPTWDLSLFWEKHQNELQALFKKSKIQLQKSEEDISGYIAKRLDGLYGYYDISYLRVTQIKRLVGILEGFIDRFKGVTVLTVSEQQKSQRKVVNDLETHVLEVKKAIKHLESLAMQSTGWIPVQQVSKENKNEKTDTNIAVRFENKWVEHTQGWTQATVRFGNKLVVVAPDYYEQLSGEATPGQGVLVGDISYVGDNKVGLMNARGKMNWVWRDNERGTSGSSARLKVIEERIEGSSLGISLKFDEDHPVSFETIRRMFKLLDSFNVSGAYFEAKGSVTFSKVEDHIWGVEAEENLDGSISINIISVHAGVFGEAPISGFNFIFYPTAELAKLHQRPVLHFIAFANYHGSLPYNSSETVIHESKIYAEDINLEGNVLTGIEESFGIFNLFFSPGITELIWNETIKAKLDQAGIFYGHLKVTGETPIIKGVGEENPLPQVSASSLGSGNESSLFSLPIKKIDRLASPGLNTPVRDVFEYRIELDEESDEYQQLIDLIAKENEDDEGDEEEVGATERKLRAYISRKGELVLVYFISQEKGARWSVAITPKVESRESEMGKLILQLRTTPFNPFDKLYLEMPEDWDSGALLKAYEYSNQWRRPSLTVELKKYTSLDRVLPDDIRPIETSIWFQAQFSVDSFEVGPGVEVVYEDENTNRLSREINELINSNRDFLIEDEELYPHGVRSVLLSSKGSKGEEVMKLIPYYAEASAGGQLNTTTFDGGRKIYERFVALNIRHPYSLEATITMMKRMKGLLIEQLPELDLSDLNRRIEIAQNRLEAEGRSLGKIDIKKLMPKQLSEFLDIDSSVIKSDRIVPFIKHLEESRRFVSGVIPVIDLAERVPDFSDRAPLGELLDFILEIKKSYGQHIDEEALAAQGVLGQIIKKRLSLRGTPAEVEELEKKRRLFDYRALPKSAEELEALFLYVAAFPEVDYKLITVATKQQLTAMRQQIELLKLPNVEVIGLSSKKEVVPTITRLASLDSHIPAGFVTQDPVLAEMGFRNNLLRVIGSENAMSQNTSVIVTAEKLRESLELAYFWKVHRAETLTTPSYWTQLRDSLKSSRFTLSSA